MSTPDNPLPAEFIKAFTKNQRRLYAFVLSLLGSPTDADDVLQETNLVLWKKAEEFRPGSDFLAWAFRVAQLQVMAFRKSQLRRREYFDDELLQQLFNEADRQLREEDRRHEALRHCLEKLSHEQQSLIARRYEPGASVNAMAAASGRTPKAVSATLLRIREALLRCIEHRLAHEGEG